MKPRILKEVADVCLAVVIVASFLIGVCAKPAPAEVKILNVGLTLPLAVPSGVEAAKVFP